MQKRIPAVFMRGGTSKAVFFHENHLPKDPAVRDRVILAAYGSPDPNRRQIDGMGGAICTAGAAKIKGTIVNEMFGGDNQAESIRIGHPGGIMEIGVKLKRNGNAYEYVEAVVGRTARRLMEGYVCVPEKYY